MRITFLGTGSAYGSPACGDFWEDNVDHNNPKNTRLRYSILLEDNGNQLLIDCGPDFRQQSITHKINNFNDVFYTHGHPDHMIGTWELDKYTKIYNKHLNLWASDKTLEVLNMHFNYILKDTTRFTLNQIEEFKNYKIADMDITTLKFPHANTDSFSLKYKNTFISADISSIPKENEKYLENLDLLITECTCPNQKRNPNHLCLEQILEMANKFKPKKIILTHLNREFDHETMNKELPANIELAWDGMVIDIIKK